MMTNFIPAFVVILSSICFYLLTSRRKPLRFFIWTVYLATLALATYLFFSTIVFRINNPKPWDFTAFYLWGKAAAEGYNFYLPENLHTVYNSLVLPPLNYNGFFEEIVNVGFFYPPPTILYFAPLGFLSYHTAMISWILFNLIFAFGCIYLIYDQFFRTYKVSGLILVCTLFFIFTPVRTTILYAQTNFILLFYLLLIKKYSDKKISGLFLALAIFTKPYFIILGLFFLVRKNWGAVVYFILSAVAISGLTILLFGKSPFLSYIFDNPARRMSAFNFTEDINQSLHAVLLRSNLLTLDRPSVYTYISIGILLLTGVYLLFLLKRKLYDYILVVLLLVGLFLYPGTLSYYAVVLLFVVFQFFNEKNQFGFSSYLCIPITGIAYYLCTFNIFPCICFFLTIIVLKSIKQSGILIPATAEST